MEKQKIIRKLSKYAQSHWCDTEILGEDNEGNLIVSLSKKVYSNGSYENLNYNFTINTNSDLKAKDIKLAVDDVAKEINDFLKLVSRVDDSQKVGEFRTAIANSNDGKYKISVSADYNTLTFTTEIDVSEYMLYDKQYENIVSQLKNTVLLNIQEYRNLCVSGDKSLRLMFLKNKIESSDKIPDSSKKDLFMYIGERYKSRVPSEIESKYNIKYYYQMFARLDLLDNSSILKDILDSIKNRLAIYSYCEETYKEFHRKISESLESIKNLIK